MNDEFSTWDAAYVLGALTPQERADFERHLAQCAQCRESVRALAGMPGLLASASAPAPAADPPPAVLPKLLEEVRRRRRRSRTAFVSTALAAAASLIAVVVLAVSSGGTDQPISQAMKQTFPSPLNADAALTSAPWGTKIDVNCEYKKVGEAYTPRLYRLQVNDKAGHHDEVATWDAIPGETMKVEGVTRVPREDITSIVIQTDSGKPILRLRM